MTGLLLEEADQNLVAVGHGHFLEALDQLREEGIGNVFNNDAEKAAAARNQGCARGCWEK